MMIQKLLVIGIIFMVGCSTTSNEEPEKKVDATEEKVDPNVYCGNINDAKTHLNKLNAIEVNWMYMDDSLKNLCRPLNFKLPLMKSNILHLPIMAGIEISRLPVFKNFESNLTGSGQVNDTTFHYFINMRKGNCKCKIVRYYYGDSTSKSFEGYVVVEHVTCNAVDKNHINADYHTHIPHSEKENENDSTYEVHGHDH